MVQAILEEKKLESLLSKSGLHHTAKRAALRSEKQSLIVTRLENIRKSSLKSLDFGGLSVQMKESQQHRVFFPNKMTLRTGLVTEEAKGNTSGSTGQMSVFITGVYDRNLDG